MGWTPSEFYGGERGATVTERDRSLLRAVDLVERSMHSCGHSLLVTTDPGDMGHFKGETEYCEACKTRDRHDKAAGEDKVGGRMHYVVDRRLADETG